MTDFRKLGKGITGALTKASEAASKAQKDVLPAAERDANLAKFLEGSKAPPTVYHATSQDVNQFSPKKMGSNTKHPTAKLGFFTAANPESTEDFISSTSGISKGLYESGANIMPLHLSIKNPYEIPSSQYMLQSMALQNMKKKDAEKFIQEFKDSLIQEGHDGLLIKANPRGLAKGNEYSSDNWVAFEPEQIKSAISNRGTYDITDPDISKAKGGVLHMADAGKVVRGGLKAIQAASKAADEQMAVGKLKAALEAQQAPMTTPSGTGLPLMPRDQGMYTPREQKDLPRMPTVDKARAANKSPKYNERTQDLLDSPKARKKVDNLINKGKDLNVQEWYGTEPLRQVAMDAGRTPEQFESMLAQLASASQRNPVDKQNQMGSYLYHLSETGQLPADSLLLTNKLKKALKDDPSLAEGRTLVELPTGYGSLAQGDIFNRAVMIGQGKIGEALPPNKKLGTFYENLLGNLQPVTVDVNALRGPIIEQGDPRWLTSKLVEKDDKGKVINSYKPREMFDTGEMTMREAKQRPGFWEAAPKGSEYAGFEELWQRGAKRHNIAPAEAQALGWYGSADVTALKTKPENYVDNLERLIKRTAEQTGQSPTKVMDDLVTGKGFLRKDGGSVSRQESPEDMARFQKRFAMHKAIGGRVKKMAGGGRVSIFDAPKMASGGRASIFDTPVKHMAGGGKVSSAKFYAPRGGANAQTFDVPGVGPVNMFVDEQNKRIVVSDEGYWNPNSPTGENLQKAVQWAHDNGYQAGVAITPYSSKTVLNQTGTKSSMPGATDDELRAYVDAADFVVTDPYLADINSTAPQNKQALIDFTNSVGDYAKDKGKDTWLYMQGFVQPGVDAEAVAAFNKELIDKTKGRYDNASFFNASDFGADQESSGVKQLDTTPLVNYMSELSANPYYDENQDAYHLAEKQNVKLPANWNSLDAASKVDWFNQNNVESDTLTKAGVRQAEIDWYNSHGLTPEIEPPKMPDYQPQVQQQIQYQEASPYVDTQPAAPTQSAGYLRSTGEGGYGAQAYYDEINSYLANHSQDEIQQAMNTYGVSQQDVDQAMLSKSMSASPAFTPGSGDDPNIDRNVADAITAGGFAKGGFAVRKESPADMARFHKRFAMHKAIGGHVKKMASGGRTSIFDAPPKRFDGGGIASPEESSASSDDRPTKAGLMAEYLAKAAKEQGKQEVSSLSKPRAATDLLNRGVLANNPLSAMVDLVNMGLIPLDILGTALTGRDIKVSSEKPFLGSEYVKDLMNKYNVTSGEERPMMETALSFASPTGMIKGAQKAAGLAKKAPEALDTVKGGLETMSANAQRPFRPATLTMEAVAPDLGQKGGDKFKDLVTSRMISGEGAPVSMERMGGRKTEQTMGQGLYENFAKQLETNPMVGITIPRAGNLSTNKRLIADIGTAGRELGQEMVAAHKFTPLLFKNPKDATAMMIGGSEPLTKDQIRDIYKLLPGMIVTHSPKNNSMFIAPFEGDALDYKKAAQAASEILGKGAKVQFGKADSTKDIMFRGDYKEMEARPPSAESTEMRNRLKKAEERIVRGPSVSQSQRQSQPSTLTSTVH
jgi:hypothetical protein